MIKVNKAYFVLAKYTTKIESFHLHASLTNGWKILLKVMYDSRTLEVQKDGPYVRTPETKAVFLGLVLMIVAASSNLINKSFLYVLNSIC